MRPERLRLSWNVEECKPLPSSRAPPSTSRKPPASAPNASSAVASHQGLTLAHFRAQLEDLRNTSLTLELNMSTFGTHPRVHLAYMGDKVSLS